MGHWKALRASRCGPSILHLFFADDLLLFADSSCSQLRVIKRCQDDLTRALGQIINLAKLKLYISPNFNNEEAQRISEVAGIPIIMI